VQNNSISSNETVEEAQIIGADCTTKKIEESEYYNCVFRNCHFNDATLKKCSFDTCTFEHCNFNMCKLTDTTIKSCKFLSSTLVGVDFTKTKVNLVFQVVFRNCNLGFSLFSTLKMIGSTFVACNMEEVDFAEAKLDESIFHFSDLSRAIFNHTDLRKIDFRGAHNYTIDPRNNFLKDAVFSEPAVMSLLDSLGIKIAEPPEQDTEN